MRSAFFGCVASRTELVLGVDPNQYVRRSVAETLRQLNDSLGQPGITEFFGAPVALYIQDALRPVSLQEHLYNEVFPALIRAQNPSISDDELVERRSHLIAKPSHDAKRPSPHATGGAVDLELRFTKTGESVALGHVDGDTSERVDPDYFETHVPQTSQDELARRNRRAFYAIMTGAAFGMDTGLTNNPTEWWHWGRGDQLSARVSGQEPAYYSFVEPSASR